MSHLILGPFAFTECFCKSSNLLCFCVRKGYVMRTSKLCFRGDQISKEGAKYPRNMAPGRTKYLGVKFPVTPVRWTTIGAMVALRLNVK